MSIFETLYAELINPIQGYCSKEELAKLFEISKSLTGPSLEIGCFCGRSTAAILLGIEYRNQISVFHHTAIDHFQCSNPDAPENLKETFIENMKRLRLRNAKLNLLATSSKSAYPTIEKNSYCMIFIDGSHRHEDALHDLKLYGRIVQKNGILLVHDCKGEYGIAVNSAVEKFMENKGHWFDDVGIINTMRMFKRLS